jgi:hypothetical protein
LINFKLEYGLILGYTENLEWNGMEWNIKYSMEYEKHGMEYEKHGMEYEKHGMEYEKHGMEYEKIIFIVKYNI